MSSSGERTHLKVVTVGDFDPQSDKAIEYDFIGRVIAGRYTIGKQIGGGGMADVFQATDEELGVDVAIKLLKPRMASDELRARMVQEARAAAQVRHEHLVRVFSTGKLDRTAYIVMELLGGPNLEQYLREYRDQRIPWREALDLLLPALEALHAVHERGYVHRDIKTGNILVSQESGRPPSAIVIDLGLVKADRALRDAASPPTTEVGRLLCTPGYTSPEQAAGNPVDRRSDVYSMGVTLYRVLAGRLPFHEARGQPMLFVLTKHIYSEPTLLAEAGAGADIPPAVAAVVESALRKHPNDRPQTMLDFAEALRAAAASVGTAPSTTDRQAHRGGRRPPALRFRQLHGLLLAFGLGAAITGMATPRAACPEVPAAAHHPVAGMSSNADSTNARAPVDPGDATPPALWSVPLALDVEPQADPSDASVWVSAADLQTDEVQADAEPVRSRPASPASRRSTPEPAGPRAIARRQADVQRCADVDTGGSDRLAIAVNIDTAGRVFAHVVGAPESTLSRCLDKALKHTPLVPPREPVSFVHVFKLRPTPSRP
jgi:hypothetical protein